jgi:hypothetical protein
MHMLPSQRSHNGIILALDIFLMAWYRAIKKVSVCADWVVYCNIQLFLATILSIIQERWNAYILVIVLPRVLLVSWVRNVLPPSDALSWLLSEPLFGLKLIVCAGISLVERFSLGHLLSERQLRTTSRNTFQTYTTETCMTLCVLLYHFTQFYTSSMFSRTEISWNVAQPISTLLRRPSSRVTIRSPDWSDLLPTNTTGASTCKKSYQEFYIIAFHLIYINCIV